MPSSESNNTVKYLITIHLSENGRLILPKEYCSAQNLQAGSPITLLSIGNGLLLLPKINKFNSLCARIEEKLDAHSITESELLETLPETRREIFSEFYPNVFADEGIL